MSEPISVKVQLFLKTHETECFTKLVTDPTEIQNFDSRQEYIEALAQKETLLSTAYSLLKTLLGELDLTDHLLRKDTENIQEEIKKTIVLHNQETSEMKSMLAEHYSKEASIEGQLIQSNQQLQKVLALNEQKSKEYQLLKHSLVQLNQSFEQRVSFCNLLTSQLEQLHNDYLRLSEFNQLKLQQLTSITARNQKMQINLRDYEQEISILQIDNRELTEQILKLRTDLDNIYGKVNMYEVMIGKTQTQQTNENDKQNIPSINVLRQINSEKRCENYHSPRNVSKQDIKCLKTDPSSIESASYSKENLNQIYLLKSGVGTSENRLINIEDKLLQYMTPVYRTDITDFEHCKIQTNFEHCKIQTSIIEQPSPAPDPYNCFFMLLVQCAKLNHHRFELAAQVILNDLWEKFLTEATPMNKWAKIIQKELQQRVSLKFKSKKNSVVTNLGISHLYR